ncbi:hypothetical protein ACT1U9_22655 [Streptomyces sp. BR1]|uniref:hypothetical protein n=1 Tax=Streptomyces sp. BR1 TaxID=1592323 RepID=UPI00402B28B3
MPASRRKATARIRALYTGEKPAAAQAGIARDHSIGLDACRSDQHQIRALLAIGFLNQGIDYDGPAGWQLAVLNTYTFTVSPRFERLALITDVPDNVANRLLRRPAGTTGLPGLRLEEYRSGGSYVMRHLPTCAQIVVTRNSFGAPTGTRKEPHSDCMTTDTPITDAERDQLATVPRMTMEAQCLLAGVFSRIGARDPHGTWAIGNWFYDPLERPGWLDNPRSPFEARKLHGADDSWELEWGAYPYPGDLATAMTDPVVGIPGARTVSAAGDLTITLGGAALHLRSRRA